MTAIIILALLSFMGVVFFAYRRYEFGLITSMLVFIACCYGVLLYTYWL